MIDRTSVESAPVDVMLPVDDVHLVRDGARRLEEDGFRRIYVAEGAHDPFVLAGVLTEHTSSAEIGTDVAIAFARTPMTVAHTAWDLQSLSGGRFVLGLGVSGPQVVEGWYGQPFPKPLARTREYVDVVRRVLAREGPVTNEGPHYPLPYPGGLGLGKPLKPTVHPLRAIWSAWERGEATAFDGEFYHHTLVGPPFSPGPNPFGPPRVLLAGVGPRMVETAGEVADGFLVHPFNTAATIDTVVLPALGRGAAARRGLGGPLEVVAQFMVVTGATGEEMAAAREAARAQIAFYGSTPAYKVVVGDPDLHDRLHTMSRQGQWSDMASLVPDELLERVAVIAEPGDVVQRARERAAPWADRMVLMPPGGVASAGVEATLVWYEQLAAAAVR